MPTLRLLIALGLVLAGLTSESTTLRAAEYVLTDLGGGSAVAINNSGIIALNETNKAFRVTNGVRQELRIVTAVWQLSTQYVQYANTVKASAINDAGHVVGLADQIGSFLDVGDTNYFNGNMANRFSPVYRSINNSGGVAGGDLATDGRMAEWHSPRIFSGPTEVRSTLTGTLSGTPKDYYPGGVWADLNEAGVAVGSISSGELWADLMGSFQPRFQRGRAAKSQAGGIVFLDSRDPGVGAFGYPVLAAPLSEAFAINASGTVVGRMAIIADGPVHAFRHVGAGLEDLGTLGGTNSGALDINASGVIVGYSTLANGESRAFLWQGGTMVDLNTLVPAGSGLVLTRANAINNAGQIVGEAQAGGSTNAFLLSPAPVVPPDPELVPHTLLGLQVKGTVGASYRIDFTPTLGVLNWQPLDTVTLTNAAQWWVDFESATQSQRTYRAVRLP